MLLTIKSFVIRIDATNDSCICRFVNDDHRGPNAKMKLQGQGRVAGWVGSDFLSAVAGRVKSGQRFAGSGWVGSKKSDPWTTLRLTSF